MTEYEEECLAEAANAYPSVVDRLYVRDGVALAKAVLELREQNARLASELAALQKQHDDLAARLTALEEPLP